METHSVEYFQPSAPRCLDRDNVGLIVKLRVKLATPSSTDTSAGPTRPGRNSLVVANTHLLYNPKRQDVKLAQTVLLLAGMRVTRYLYVTTYLKVNYLISFSELDRVTRGNQVPCIITGDLNLYPGSPVHEFITSGSFTYANKFSRLLTTPTKWQGKDIVGKYLLPMHLGITDQCQVSK